MFLIALTIFGDMSHDEAIKPMKAALDSGATFWNAVSTMQEMRLNAFCLHLR